MTTPSPLTRSGLAEKLGVSRVTLIAWQRDGLIPEPTVVNGRRVEFDSTAILIATALAEARGHGI